MKRKRRTLLTHMPGKGAIFRITTNSDEIPRLSFYSDDVIRYKANIV